MSTFHGPPAETDALAQSQRLVDCIRAEIAASDGWISFARYMELALYTPELGYYAGGAEKFGAAGDFVTAPELTPLFAQALANQVAEIMAQSAPNILEFGAGSGRLAADLLTALQRLDALPQRYDILELSAELRQRQRHTLRSTTDTGILPNWLDRLPDNFSGVVIANEVLDAMPVHRIVWQKEGIFERGVGLDPAGHFQFCTRPASASLQAEAECIAQDAALPPGYESELALAAPRWLSAWGERLKTGVLLLIDYGFTRRELFHPQRNRGTLRCHYRHRAHDDPFFLPGLQDITAHVDFTALAHAADSAGLEIHGYTSQGQFLVNCGLLDALAALPADSAAYRRSATACHQLLLPQGMGETFKVIAIGRGLEAELMGFSAGDRSFRL